MSRYFHKRKGALYLDLVMYGVIIAILFAGISGVGNSKNGVQDDILKNQGSVIDRALSLWYASHSGQYPAQITTLQSMGIISNQIPISSFTYSVRNNQTEYSLSVDLTTGAYKTPGSSY